MLTMSPSEMTVESGMPWQMIALSDVQQDFGKPLYPSVDGYAPWSIMYSWAMRSSSSVGTPGATALPAAASAPAAMRPATRIFSITSGVCTQGSLPSLTVVFHAYSGGTIERGTGSVDESTPGRRAVRTGMTPRLTGE